jgi:hypothetical protein
MKNVDSTESLRKNEENTNFSVKVKNRSIILFFYFRQFLCFNANKLSEQRPQTSI